MKVLPQTLAWSSVPKAYCCLWSVKAAPSVLAVHQVYYKSLKKSKPFNLFVYDDYKLYNQLYMDLKPQDCLTFCHLMRAQGIC